MKSKGPLGASSKWYTPKALGNQDAPTREQVRVKIRALTSGDRVSMGIEHQGEIEIIDGKLVVPRASSKVAKDLVELQIVEVENYVDAEDKPFRNGRDLWAAADDELLAELVNVLLERFVSDQKRSVGLRGSASSETDHSVGAATSAENSDSKPNEGASLAQ